MKTRQLTARFCVQNIVRKHTSLAFESWRTWFVDTAKRLIDWVPPEGVVVFFQTDSRFAGRWVDKSYLVLRAVEERGASLVWHKIACRQPPGFISPGRPSYAHVLCVSRLQKAAPSRPGPDILACSGAKTWPRGMGFEVCRVICRYLLDETPTRVIVDPFCGEGMVLAVANMFGLEAIGVDLSARRLQRALQLAAIQFLSSGSNQKCAPFTSRLVTSVPRSGHS